MNDKNQYRINTDLKNVSQLRLVGDNVEPGIYSYSEAMEFAEELQVDLIEIANNPIPVCKLIDYQKFLYQKKQKLKEQKQNSKKQELKEIRISPDISNHDYEFKLKHAEEFLKKGNRIKFTMKLLGRKSTEQYKDRGIKVFDKLIVDLINNALLETAIKFENKQMFCIFKPKKA